MPCNTRKTTQHTPELPAPTCDPAPPQALCEQSVELVFTAHPTQAFRQSLLKKYAAVRQLMDKLHTQRMSPYERLECMQSIRAQVGRCMGCVGKSAAMS